jgi:DNA-binding HxlR family transcriptional regulator
VDSSKTEAVRSYGQFCGLANALDLVGDRWALLVVRELALGPRRFTDLLGGLPGVSTNVLATRLRELERGGVIRRTVLDPPAASSVYELTEYGRELEPAMLALGRWGAKTLGPRGNRAIRSNWLVLALKAFFHAGAVTSPRVYEVRLPGMRATLDVSPEQIEVRAAPSGQPDLVIEADVEGLIALLAVGAADGVTVVAGEDSELARFVDVFRFAEPEPALV